MFETFSNEDSPNTYYEVYLNLPKGVPPHFRSLYYVGNVSFFFKKPNGKSKVSVRYDVSSIVKGQKLLGNFNENNISVTFAIPELGEGKKSIKVIGNPKIERISFEAR